MKVHKVVGASVALASVIFLLASCTPTPIAGLSVEHGPIPGPGQFDIKIIVINATFTGPITCDHGITITPSGTPYAVGDQEITEAILEVPQSFPEGTVTCFVPTNVKTFPFTIWVGPPQPPKGGPPRLPLHLSLNKTSILCKSPLQRVTLQLTMANELSKPVTVINIKSAHRLLIFAAASPTVPITLAPREQKKVSLQFTCTGFGIVKNSLVELQLADGSVMIL
jgi:hypothetical protein